MSHLRSFLRKHLLTMNTIRYRVEWRCLAAAASRFEPFGLILDGGCASGEMLRMMLDAGYAKSGIGIEPDPEMIPLFQKNLGGRKNVQIFRTGLENIPLPDQHVDAIMTTQVLEHIREHEKVAAEFARVLKPGGALFVGVPHPPEPFPNEDHVREGYTEEDLRSLFEPLGFQSVSFDYYLIDKTMRRVRFANTLPLQGKFLPVQWADCEATLSTEERRRHSPFGILGVFTKPAWKTGLPQ